jgi:hypothetical protein
MGHRLGSNLSADPFKHHDLYQLLYQHMVGGLMSRAADWLLYWLLVTSGRVPVSYSVGQVFTVQSR